MFFGISLFKQVFCEGGIDIGNNTTKSHLAVRPLTTYPVCSTPNQRSCHVRPWRNGLGVQLLQSEVNSGATCADGILTTVCRK